ncbi:hypothetical protein [Xenorhabdus entomophaga]|uniref:hypothetical protein n=1 Tax=Xenorhabdus entomophaga TaxID=3136257 RepID=UPI0030F43CA2
MAHIKFTDTFNSKQGIKFQLSTDGGIYASSEIHPIRRIASANSTEIHWRHSCCRILKFGDLYEMETELSKYQRRKYLLRKRMWDIYNAILSGDIKTATEICEYIQSKTK